MDLNRFIKTLKTLMHGGIPKDRALQLIRTAHGLTLEQTESLDRRTK